ncbi:MAG: LuxR C-terminal-related transcriptional regulator [Chloroflexota bacterium]
MAVTQEPNAPGLILLRDDDTVERLTPAARNWLNELVDSTNDVAEVPLLAMSVVHQARRAGRGQTDDVATIRLPKRGGGWLRLDASLLDDDADGRVAIIIGPAREPEIAPLVADAYGLSPREGEVTRLVLSGRSTQEIAGSLGVSPFTVQDHLKAIFEKVGVRSRRELVAQLFLQQCAPLLQAGAPIASGGWFAAADAS